MSASDHVLGIVVVSYHSNADLIDFCRSLREADPKVPYYLNIQLVEVTQEEHRVGTGLVEAMGNHALRAGLSSHLTNVGYSGACNDGAFWAELVSQDAIDTYAFLNADTLITPGSLESCVETLFDSARHGVLGPRQVDQRNRITHAGIYGSNTHPAHRGWHELASDGRYSDVRDDCVTVSGSAYFVRASVWDELRDCPTYRQVDPASRGAFLLTPHFYEETWCSYHATAHGYKVVYNGNATIVHKWQGATPTPEGKARVQRLFFESRELFRSACDLHGIPHD